LWILDMTAGYRSMWLQKEAENTIFVDIRREVKPTIVADSKLLPLRDGIFGLVVFDPPYKYFSTASRLAQIFGNFRMQDVIKLEREGTEEAARVLQPEGLLLFKWGGSGRTTKSCLKLFSSHFQPLIAHHLISRSKFGPRVDYVILLKVDPANRGCVLQ
jgi:SAM-dependent methyltransferase